MTELNISRVARETTRDQIAKAKASIKAKGLIHNPILGWATPKEINDCIKNKIITFKNNTYCIPMEFKLSAKDIRNPKKEWVVSPKFIDYMVKTGRMRG